MAEGGAAPAGRADVLGRTAELGDLSRALADACGGRPRTVLVHGEAGIGKTTVVAAASEDALERGFHVVWGHAWSGAGAPPFWPWIQVLRAAPTGEEDGEAPGRVGPSSLADLLAGAQAPPGRMTSAPGERFALFDAVTGALAAWTADKPAMLVLEDLHWADEGTWQLALFVSRNITRNARLLLVLTSRRGEAMLDPARAGLWHRVSREALPIELEPLGEGDAAALFARVAGYDLSEEGAGRLRTVTGGNPLFLEEIARLAAEAGSELTPEALLDVQAVPAAEAAVRRAEALLDVHARHALELLAAAGVALPTQLLAVMLDASVGDVTAALRPAASLGLLTFTGTTVAFRHEVFRRACYDGMAAERRNELHQSIAIALQEADDEANVFAVADHLLRGDMRDPAAVAWWGHKAGTRALASFAPAAALRYFDAAIAASSPLDAAVRSDLWTGRLRALTGQGLIEGMDDALLSALDAADEARDPVRAARAVAAMSGVYFHRGARRGLERRLTRILDRLGRDEPVLRAALLSELSSLPSWAPPGVRHAAALEALSLARHGGDPVVLANALLQATWKHWDEQDEWVSLATELTELGEDSHQPDAVIGGCVRLAAYHLERGRHQELHAQIERVVAIADLTGLPHHTWGAKVTRALAAAIRGRYSLSGRLADEALELLDGHPAALTTWYAETALRAVLCGGLHEHIELGETLDHSGDWSDLQLPYCGLAAMHAAAGDHELARSVLGRLLPGVRDWRRDPLWLPSIAFLGWAAADVGDAASAGELYELLAPYEDRMLYMNTGVPCAYWGSAAWVLAALAAATGRRDVASRHYEYALARQSAFGDRPWLAYVKLRFALHLAGEETPQSRSRAEALFCEARQAADELGLHRLLGEIEFFECPSDAASMQPSTPALLFRREGDYWSVGDPDRPSRVKGMRGLEHIGLLLDNPGRDVHVLEMVAPARGGTRQPAPRDDDLSLADPIGDAVLDEQAKAAYRHRIEELRDDMEEAEERGDSERAARAREELEALTDHLAAALGFGGRDRRMGSDAERARVAVTKAIRAALDRLTTVEPEAASWLRSRIRTGMLCRYDAPERDSPPLRVLR